MQYQSTKILNEPDYYRYAKEKKNWHESELLRVREFIEEKFKNGEVRSMLEVGCGLAEVIPFLPTGIKYTGLDSSEFCIKTSKNKYPAHSFVTAYAEKMPFGDELFDLVLSINTLEHVYNPKKVLKEIARAVREGGYIILISPNLEAPWSTINAIRHYSLFKKMRLVLERWLDLFLRNFGILTFRIIPQNYTQATRQYDKSDDDLIYIASAYEVATFFKRNGFKEILSKKIGTSGRLTKVLIKKAIKLIPAMEYYGGGMFFILKRNKPISRRNMVKKIIYLSYPQLEFALNAVTIKGLRKNGIEIAEFHVKDRKIAGFFAAVSYYRHHSKNVDALVIGYDSPALVIVLRFFCRKPIVYNAVLSVYERIVVSRRLISKFSLKAIYYWLLDFMAVHLANLIFVESEHQTDYFKKIFKVSGNKVHRSWIGVDNDNFFYDPAIKKRDIFTVVFRGRLLPEAGAEYVVMAAKKLEAAGIDFIMLANGQEVGQIKMLIDNLRPKNLKFITAYLSNEELRSIMQSSHISLGQLNNHERLKRTIPHKVYESLAMKLPYLTAANTGILELVSERETCIICEPASAESLAEKILWAMNNPRELEKIAENGYKLYQNKLRPHILAQNLLDKMNCV